MHIHDPIFIVNSLQMLEVATDKMTCRRSRKQCMTFLLDQKMHACDVTITTPYLHEKGLMGSAPYTEPRLGDGSIFKVSMWTGLLGVGQN